jgi:hypothetical protein
MSWSARIRQGHRSLSIAFTVAVVINVVALVREQQAVWVGMLALFPLALFPLALLQLSGLYLLVLPYVRKRRAGRVPPAA